MPSSNFLESEQSLKRRNVFFSMISLVKKYILHFILLFDRFNAKQNTDNVGWCMLHKLVNLSGGGL